VAEKYFDGRIAKTYEAKWPELFEPAPVDPVVAFLAELAGTGATLELGIGTVASRSRSAGGAFGCTGWIDRSHAIAGTDQGGRCAQPACRPWIRRRPW
jgi:hypothetical protein